MVCVGVSWGWVSRDGCVKEKEKCKLGWLAEWTEGDGGGRGGGRKGGIKDGCWGVEISAEEGGGV